MRQKTRFFEAVPRSTETVELGRKSRRGELEEDMYFEDKEIQALFSVIKSKRDRAIFRLAYHRGLRAHEVGLLQMDDWRDRDGVLYVHRGKGSISREHSLTDEECRVLRAWLRERGTFPGPIFPSRQGRKGISRFRLDQLMKRYCRLARIAPAKAHMHALKHSCGTHLAERGARADEIQDWLGHREISSTDIYLHFTRRRRSELADKHRDWR
jgi:type 1 fimbriae regulatory protein FimB/type 1 fimbriae regulatory protein FimE